MSLKEQEAQYWSHSRYPPAFLPLLPIRVFPATEPASIETSPTRVGFFSALEATCRALLASGPAPAPSPEGTGNGELPRAAVVRMNGRLTLHTVQSMQCGATRGWTTLTANRSSVKAVLREVRARGGYGVEARGRDVSDGRHAALWIIDPRSLAQGMRSDISASPA